MNKFCLNQREKGEGRKSRWAVLKTNSEEKGGEAMGYFKTNTSEGKERVEGWKVGGGGGYCSEIGTGEKP